MMVRNENATDIPAIRALVARAFKDAPHSMGTEAAIVDALRDGSALTVSLVAEREGEIVGHVAFSRVKIDGEAVDWYGLGPIAVRPDSQGCGIGVALIEAGLERIKALNGRGCVVLGDPAYYSRFGFKSDPALRFADVRPQHFQRLDFGDKERRGVVEYHPAFFAT
jgi:putative acetyltransferase